MTDATFTGAACPGCAAMPASRGTGPFRSLDGVPLRRVELSLPEIHCVNCINGVEDCLAALPEVETCRVNLGLKRVTVTAADRPDVEDHLLDSLKSAGFTANRLDSTALDATRRDDVGRALLARIGVAGFALMAVMLFSFSVWFGADGSTRDIMHWMSALISIPAVAFSAQPFFRNAILGLRGGRMDMDLPISTAILLAVGVSLWETANSGEHAFFDAALMLTFFLLVGRYLAHLTRRSARSAAAELAALEVQRAWRVSHDGTVQAVTVDTLNPGDVVEVAANARIPVDGTVLSGSSEIDCSMLTGETLPEQAAPGARVSAGMLNLSGTLRITVNALGEDTLLHEISELVASAEQSRSRYSTIAERASGFYGHTVNILAAAAFLGWGILGQDWYLAVTIAAAVLIITCPCALGLAVPAVLASASGKLFRKGVLLTDGDALERLAGVDTVVFDKTGTLTNGRPQLIDPEEIDPGTLALAAGIAGGSSHPLCVSILDATARTGISPAQVDAIEERPGFGLEGTHDGRRIRLGRADWVGADHHSDRTATWLRIGDDAPVPLIFRDVPRPEAAQAVRDLKNLGLTVMLVSGDTEAPVAAVARELGIDTWTSGATPPEKVDILNGLEDKGQKTLMVGDGLNDAAALASAHVSISPATAVTASRSASDMILLGGNLDHIVEVIELARASRRRIVENFALAFGYNIITVPIAFMGFVTPLIAALAMSASSIAVSLNAMRLGDTK